MSYAGDGIPPLGVAQSQMFNDPSSRQVGVAGRRLGKTTYAGVRAFKKAYVKKRAEVRYIAPTYKMAKEIFWEPLKRIIPRRYMLKAPNETSLSIILLNESRIQLLGAENPDRLRGPGLDDAIFDEFADIDPTAWFEVIEPALSDREGTACFLGTPKGYNHFYDLYQQGLSDDPRWSDWSSFAFTTAQGGRVKKSIIEKARATLDFRVFRQEYEASFETMTGRVYDNFSRKQWPAGNWNNKIVDRGGTLYIGLDFNINPMSAVILQDVGGSPQVLDEIELFSSNTDEMAKELRKRYPDRRLIICPDASGDAGSTNAPVGQTSFTILQGYNLQILADNVNPNVVDRVNNTQSLLLSANGLRRVSIHPRCAKLTKALEGLVWEEGKTKINKKMGLDHITDAFGYALWQQWNVLHNLLPKASPVGGDLHSPYGAEAA